MPPVARFVRPWLIWPYVHARRIGVAALGGVLYAAALPGVDGAFLAWVCLVPLFGAIDENTLGFTGALVVGWAFGAASACVLWVSSLAPLQEAFQLSSLGVGAAFLGMSVASGVPWGLASALLYRVAVRGTAPFVLAAPAAVILAEWVLPGSYPMPLGSALHGTPVLLQGGAFWGALGLSFLLAFGNGVVYRFARALWRSDVAMPWAGAAAFACLMAISLAYGFFAITDVEDTLAHAVGRLRIGVVQAPPPVSETEDVNVRAMEHRMEQAEEVLRQGVDLVCWTPWSARPLEVNVGANLVAQRFATRMGSPVVAALPVRDQGHDVARGAFLLGPSGAIQKWSAERRLWAGPQTSPMSFVASILGAQPSTRAHRRVVSLNPGTDAGAPQLDQLQLGVLLEDEGLHPRSVGLKVADGANLMLVFGYGVDGSERLHAQRRLGLMKLRAVEQRRFMIAANRGGLSAVIDSVGRVVAQAPMDARANLVQTTTLLGDRTWYARHGDWVPILALGLYGYWLRDVFLGVWRRFRLARRL